MFINFTIIVASNVDCSVIFNSLKNDKLKLFVALLSSHRTSKVKECIIKYALFSGDPDT